MAPPSEKQTATLEKLGIMPSTVECAGKAAKLLDRLTTTSHGGDSTTPKQEYRLLEAGFQSRRLLGVRGGIQAHLTDRGVRLACASRHRHVDVRAALSGRQRDPWGGGDCDDQCALN